MVDCEVEPVAGQFLQGVVPEFRMSIHVDNEFRGVGGRGKVTTLR